MTSAVTPPERRLRRRNEMNLRDYWRIVRRRRLVIIASTILVSAFSLRVEARVRHTDEEMWVSREANRVISPGAESSVLLSLHPAPRGGREDAPAADGAGGGPGAPGPGRPPPR